MQFTDHGIEGVVPPDLLPPDVRLKFHARPNEKAKRAKKEEEAKDAVPNAEDSQVVKMNFTLLVHACGWISVVLLHNMLSLVLPCLCSHFNTLGMLKHVYLHFAQ